MDLKCTCTLYVMYIIIYNISENLFFSPVPSGACLCVQWNVAKTSQSPMGTKSVAVIERWLL